MPSDQSISRWLDIGAFQAAPLGTFGNCSVGVGRAPGYTNVDLVLSKRFAAGGPRYAVITDTISSPRVIELVLKFSF